MSLEITLCKAIVKQDEMSERELLPRESIVEGRLVVLVEEMNVRAILEQNSGQGSFAGMRVCCNAT
jgi:hypothetical protein